MIFGRDEKEDQKACPVQEKKQKNSHFLRYVVEITTRKQEFIDGSLWVQ